MSSSYRSRLGRLCVGVVAAAAMVAPALASGAVLYDQTSNGIGGNRGSNDWEPPNDGFDDRIADDFTVPAGQTWELSQLDVLGASSGSSYSVNVAIYANAGTLPGSLLFSQTVSGGTTPDYALPLTGAPTLDPGTYWISAQQAGSTPGEAWYWRERSTQTGNPAVYRNPGGMSVATCTDWVALSTCYPGDNPDRLFKLSGTATPLSPTETGQRGAAIKKCKKKYKGKAKAKKRKRCIKKAKKLPV